MTYDILLISNPSSKNRVYWKKKKREENKIKSNLCISNKRKKQIESSVSNEQEIIWAKIDVFWTIQLTRNISIDDEQYIPRTFI